MITLSHHAPGTWVTELTGIHIQRLCSLFLWAHLTWAYHAVSVDTTQKLAKGKLFLWNVHRVSVCRLRFMDKRNGRRILSLYSLYFRSASFLITNMYLLYNFFKNTEEKIQKVESTWYGDRLDAESEREWVVCPYISGWGTGCIIVSANEMRNSRRGIGLGMWYKVINSMKKSCIDNLCYIEVQISQKQSEIPVNISGGTFRLDHAIQRHLCMVDNTSKEAIQEKYTEYKKNKAKVPTLGNNNIFF